jgi:peptide/nickel transport system permease protein
LLPPGTYAWSQPELLILPVVTLVIVIVPYIFRMMRAAMIEALESDYVEMARLKGVPERRIVLRHALPNAIAPTIQVIGLNFLYLAGGVVVVEFVFNYPGIGQGLVFAVGNRDIPVIQFIVVVLAAFYVCMNILTDVIALLATPRRRIAARLWPSPRTRSRPRPPRAPGGWSATRGCRCSGRRYAPPGARSASHWPAWSC